MKIIHEMQAFDIGGSEQLSVNLATDLAKKGHEFCVLAITKPLNQSDIGKEMKARLHIDASQSPDEVVARINQAILDTMTDSTEKHRG